MKASMVGDKMLPESLSDFDKLLDNGGETYINCSECGEVFSDDNTKSPAGWRETQMSGMCEACFDALHEEEEDES